MRRHRAEEEEVPDSDHSTSWRGVRNKPNLGWLPPRRSQPLSLPPFEVLLSSPNSLEMIRNLVAQRARACARTQAVRQFHATPCAAALTKFLFPAMSPTMTEGGIAQWKKKEGESFAPGDVLLEIETDKATMDVEAQDEGVLGKILVGDGSKAVQVGSPVAVIGEEGDDFSEEQIQFVLKEAPSGGDVAEPKQESKQEKKPEEPKKEEPKKEEAAPKKQESKKQSSLELSSDRPIILASPMAKRLALENGVPLAKVKGTGPDGRILAEDVEKYKASAPSAAAAGPAAAAKASPAAGAGAAYTDTPVSNMRRTIASRLTESKSGTPHYYLTAEINMDRVNKLREAFNTAAKAADAAGASKDGVKGGVKLSVNDFIVKASALALQDVPEVNSGWHGDFIREYATQDICVAVATPNGLITPIVADAGRKGLATISSQAKQLAAKARDGKLKPEEYQGGSFTISNLGMMGIESFTAIINPPQSCILAIGASEKKLVLDPASEKGFKEVSVMKATLSCDHRVVDGAVGARWMKAFKSYLESPLSFML
uniref:Acetyltransferase component of pyruvate dehydrogenase complex n=2 Tax=Rhodotorula toruloides TaxID=5286 RepID=A0A0K3CEE9_RHOTO